MNATAKPFSQSHAFTGWDELAGMGNTWKIERAETHSDIVAPFFPDQNGGVYEKLLFDFPVMMHAMDGSGRLSSVNRQWCRTLGYHPSDVMGRSFNELLTAQSRSYLITNIYPKYLQSGMCRNEEMFVHRKDGTLATVMLSMNAYRGDKGRIERSICMLHDVTDRKIAEIASTRSDQRFRAAFVSAAHGMALVSPTGQIELANAAFYEFLGRSEKDHTTLAFDETLHRDDRGQFLNGMRQLLLGDIPSLKQELRFTTGSNTVVHGSTSVSIIRNEANEIEQLVVQVVDVTDRKLSAKRLQQAQKMEAIGQLTGGIAHDFNNLLTSILLNADVLATVIEDENIRPMAEAVRMAAERGADLTRRLLAFGRRQMLEPRPTNVKELLAGMEPLMYRTLGEHIEISSKHAADLWPATVDPGQLENAVLNLAVNARDAMPDGGRITIETLNTVLDAQEAEINPGDYVVIAVHDTGCGMSPDVVARAFEPFFTTKDVGKGTGLGLSMVYGFVKQSGGHVRLSSEVGKGTVVRLYLPRSAVAGATINGARSAPSALPRGKEMILFVEDDPMVRQHTERQIAALGYRVVTAENAAAALAHVEGGCQPDLLFTDIVMPGGVNGRQLAQKLRLRWPTLRVLYTSGYARGTLDVDGEHVPSKYVLGKPYRRSDLANKLREVLDEPQMETTDPRPAV
jgi:PAS domain S-box-containing protein